MVDEVKKEEFSEDDACDAIRALWLTMANRFTEIALDTLDIERAMKAAGYADKSYWYATGVETWKLE